MQTLQSLSARTLPIPLIYPGYYRKFTGISSLQSLISPKMSDFTPPPVVIDIEGKGLFLEPVVGGFGGLWFDKAFAGSGFNFIASDGALSVNYFGFQDNGEPLWVVSDPFDTPTTEGDTFANINMVFGGNGTASFENTPTARDLCPVGNDDYHLQ